MNLTAKSIFGSVLIALLMAACTSDFEVGEAAVKSKDYKTAFAKLSKPAEAGNAVAQFYIGMMYSEGEGVSKDEKKASYWYTKSAEQGNANAQFNLANMFFTGRGVQEDDKQAFYWFSKAAEQGNATAQYNSGLMYGNGRGVPTDLSLAYMWIRIADANGFPNASSTLKALASHMDQSEIERANQMAEKCKAQNYKDCNKLESNNSFQSEAPSASSSELLKAALSMTEKNPRFVNSYISSLGMDNVAMCAAIGAKSLAFIISNSKELNDSKSTDLVKLQILHTALSIKAMNAFESKGFPIAAIYKEYINQFKYQEMGKIFEGPWKTCDASYATAMQELDPSQLRKYMGLNFKP